jgi:alkanesulfonate monooxygenase SsuD/methylene tetrahydromethanopterin reductase-like flavin-dependent oxidoreductase (luciferase family)
MQFALFYEIPVARPWTRHSEHEAYKAVLEQAVLGEQAGFHSLWTVEHHFLEEFSHCSNPEVLYGAIAAKTSRLRLGYGVRLMPFPYNHPVRSAESAAVLDLLSDGRVEFGTGRRRRAPSSRLRHRPAQDARALGRGGRRDRRGLDAGRARVERQGVQDSAAARASEAAPGPASAALGRDVEPDSHRIMGEKGMGLLSFTIGTPPEELKQRIDMYRDGLTRAKPVGKFVNGRAATFTMVHVAPTREEARATAAESFEWYARKGTEAVASVSKWMRELGQASGTYAYGDALADLDTSFLNYDFLESSGACIVGDPATCIETAKRYEAAGCDLLLCLVNPYKIPHKAVMRTIELMGKHVLPAVTR